MIFAKKIRAVSVILVVGVLTATPASNVLADGLKLDEIVVTARKREENLTDVPESVVAISGDTIVRQNMKTLDKIGMTVPNFNLNTRSDGYPNVTMRGMGAFSLTQGVGFYLDDVQLISDPSARFGDLERVEVLKGPQGVLYGGNNIGGAVKFVTKRPSADAVSGSIKVMAGQQSSVDAEASINIPLNDDWAMRAFVYTREDDGFMYNITTKDDSIAGYEEEGGRIQIAGPLSENVSLYLAARINKWDGHNNNWVRESASATPSNFQYNYVSDIDSPSKSDKETKGLHWETVWENDGFDMTYIGSYTETDADRPVDVDLVYELWFDGNQVEDFETTTHELRFTSTTDSDLQWQAGLYSLNFEKSERSTQTFGCWVGLCGLTVRSAWYDAEREHIAAFGNVSYESGSWAIDFGLRVDSWENYMTIVDETGPFGTDNKIDGTEVTPRLSVSRTLDNDSMLYATISKGYEPGGVGYEPIITDANGNPVKLPTWDPEEALQAELGWKGSFSDGRGTAAIAAFWIDYDDRLFTGVITEPDGSIYEQVTNVGDSQQTGIEIEVMLQATENLLLSGAIGILDAEWDGGTTIGGVDMSGTTPSGAVDDGFALGAYYNRDMANGMEFIFDLQINYRGKMRTMPPGSPLDNTDYHTVNMATGIKNDGWEIMLHAENLTDEEYYHDVENNFPNLGPNGIFDTASEPLIILGTPGNPRLVSVSASYRF